MAATAGYSPPLRELASCWRWRPGARIRASRRVDVPVRAVRVARVERSARRMRPVAERERGLRNCGRVRVGRGEEGG
jgi:hypothetical protein